MAYTNIDDPSAYFQIALWTGDGSTSRDITNDGNSDLQPDWVWIKQRSGTRGHAVYDSSRGVQKRLATDTTAAEATSTVQLSAFNADGFEIGSGNACNENAQTYAAWQWKANGGTTVSNTDGALRSVTVQANQDAGFSIVRFLGGTTPYTAGHGLGVAPDVIISKRIGATVGWYVYHKDLGAGKYLRLNSDGPAVTSATEAFTSAPTSTIFTGGTGVGGATDYWINYCFAEKQGYSKFGSYIGNGFEKGPFVYTGFKPAFVIIKNYSNQGYNWRVLDSARNTFNLTDLLLIPDLDSAEFDGSTHANNIGVDFLSNGFKQRTPHTSINGSGMSYIFMAFAENPFVTSTGVPTTAR
jgi:hypothetical protein